MARHRPSRWRQGERFGVAMITSSNGKPLDGSCCKHNFAFRFDLRAAYFSVKSIAMLGHRFDELGAFVVEYLSELRDLLR